jgi:hypothetical protein
MALTRDPIGSRFLTFQELNDKLAAERAERETERTEQQQQENERLRLLLRQTGIDSDRPAG